MGAPTLTFLQSLPTALFTRTEHGALASCAPCNQSASRGSNVGPPLGAEGTPLGGCQGENPAYPGEKGLQLRFGIEVAGEQGG